MEQRPHPAHVTPPSQTITSLAVGITLVHTSFSCLLDLAVCTRLTEVPNVSVQDREITMGVGLAALPERLLLAHARGKVLFICGAGISRPAGLPDFRELVVQVYRLVDRETWTVIKNMPPTFAPNWEAQFQALNSEQKAEVKRFANGDYDVVLGMLERRLDDRTRGDSRVRQAVSIILRPKEVKPASIHKTLMALADHGGQKTIVTTNFDRLLQMSAQLSRIRAKTHSLGSIPRPSKHSDFAGVLHIHGALDRDHRKISDLVISDQDLGEFYLRRRIVPDFIYDAARLYHLVLVGYSANDPPMRYLLNAVAADGNRFDDLKERYAFVGMRTSAKDNTITLADWRNRGITPISYDSANDHQALHETLKRWADLSANNNRKTLVATELRRIVKLPRSAASDSDRDMFDHFFRRANANERRLLSHLATSARADLEWLSAIVKVCAERVIDTNNA